MEAIVAVYSDWGIGSGGTQPVVLKADRARFKELTMGAAVIVGRKTLEDFPGGKPLKGRHNIVVSRQKLEIEGASCPQYGAGPGGRRPAGALSGDRRGECLPAVHALGGHGACDQDRLGAQVGQLLSKPGRR
ncbi:MAG: dihydrofolate reductase [Oscillospiraceae bacterium]